MSIDWTINIGTIIGGVISGLLSIVGVYGALLQFWHKVDKRITAAEETLEHHASALREHGEQSKRHEGMLIDVLQDVAQIIGSMATLGNQPWRGVERRKKLT